MYSMLRSIIDNIKIIDDHGHPGFAEYFEGVPEEKRIAFAVDSYKSPQDSSAGFPYLKELHYEAYDKLYGLTREEIDDVSKKDKISTVYENKRKEIREFIDNVMKCSGVEKIIANYVIPDSLKNKENVKFIPVIDPLFFSF